MSREGPSTFQLTPVPPRKSTDWNPAMSTPVSSYS